VPRLEELKEIVETAEKVLDALEERDALRRLTQELDKLDVHHDEDSAGPEPSCHTAREPSAIAGIHTPH
jgi:hypothetical protein